jgi:segregation and condensation protein A
MPESFYSTKTNLLPSLQDEELLSLAANVQEEPSLEILVNLAKEGDINPWDIDLEKVTSEYLKAINTNIGDNLKEAGKAIFYASVLLRMKSDLLMAQSQDALNIGKFNDQDDALLEEELNESNIKQITFDDLEAALRRKFIQKAKRFRRLTLKDLITALQEAKEEEDERMYRREQRLFGYDSYNIVTPDISDDILDLTHAENLEACIEKLQAVLPEYLVDKHGVEFLEIVKILNTWSNAFLATIFLAHENLVRLEQEDFYGELWIYDTK